MDAKIFSRYNDFARILAATVDSTGEALLNETAANGFFIPPGAAVTINGTNVLGTNVEAPNFLHDDEQSLPQEEADIEAEIVKCKRRLERLWQLRKGKGIAGEPCKSEESAHRKKISGAQVVIRKNMEDLVDSGTIDGYVYAMLPKEGKPQSGCSESLRWWWKERVNFGRNGPAAFANFKAKEDPAWGGNEMIPEPATPRSLHELPSTVLGSLLSSLMPHCDPPQRCFPLEKKISPPWWPTGGEQWWHQLGMPQNFGPPPYKKPHDLKKRWKIIVLIAVIKHMIPDIGKLVRHVRRSKCLRDIMSDKNIQILLGVVHHEARLYMQEHPNVELPLSVLREGQRSLIFIDDYNADLINDREPEKPNSEESLGMEDGGSARKRKRGFGSRDNLADTNVSGLGISADGQQVVGSLVAFYNQKIRHDGGYLNPGGIHPGSLVAFYNHKIRHDGGYWNPGEIHPADIMPMPQGFIGTSNDGNITAEFGSSSNIATMNDIDTLPGRMEELPQNPDSPDWKLLKSLVILINTEIAHGC